jgi:hypothetical protein
MTRRRSRLRPAAPVAAVLAVLAVVAVLTAPAAHAAAYQYWGYYRLTDGAWQYSQQGPAQVNPADGSVEGWRWAITDEDNAQPRPPRVLPTFEQVCGAVGAQTSFKRVAVVVDYGRVVDGDGTSTPPDPVAECAVVPSAVTAAEVLAAVASVRAGDAGLVCGINGYPATGCGGPVGSLSDEQRAADTEVALSAAVTDEPSSTGSTTPGAAPFSPDQTAGPVVAPSPAATSGSGVPVVVWAGLLILLLGVAALFWGSRHREPR